MITSSTCIPGIVPGMSSCPHAGACACFQFAYGIATFECMFLLHFIGSMGIYIHNWHGRPYRLKENLVI